MKPYMSERLAAVSSYQNYIPTLSADVRKETYARMEELIADGKEYCYKGNYKHMAQIITSVAL